MAKRCSAVHGARQRHGSAVLAPPRDSSVQQQQRRELALDLVFRCSYQPRRNVNGGGERCPMFRMF
nr:hypothetical protein Iba_chr07dCG7220 [Ipomoea batatas]